MQLILFYLFAGGALLTALILVTTKKSVNAAMAMVGTMFFLAGLYVLQDAHLMAALKIIIYAGAIMVLTLFVIMLLNIREKEGAFRYGQHRPFLQFLCICIIGLFFIKAISIFHGLPPSSNITNPTDFGTVKAVGELLFTNYILQFEMASVLLLAAIVGSVTLAQKPKKKE